MMMFSSCLCLVFVIAFTNVRTVNAATTMAPTGNHTHHEHNEMENFSFNYDGHTQMLMVTAGTKCYIWQLTHKQQQSVHTDGGLRLIEIQVMGDIDNALYTVVPKTILGHTIITACGHKADSFYLVH